MKNPQESHGSDRSFFEKGSASEVSKGGGPASTDKEAALFELSKPRLFLQKSRFTSTFVADKEAASIHFDGVRGEIFYNGHNIRNMKLTESQVKWLLKLPMLLHEQGCEKGLRSRYEASLSKTLSDSSFLNKP
jgi:hypothetical protein